MRKSLFLLALSSLSLYAADGWLGTWKMDPSRSEFQNTEASKNLTLVITSEAGFHILKFTWLSPDGKSHHASFRQSDTGGKIIPLQNTPPENSVLELPNDHEWVYHYFSKDGKPDLTRYVKLSADGKTHEADMRGMRDGKMLIEHETMVKQ